MLTINLRQNYKHAYMLIAAFAMPLSMTENANSQTGNLIGELKGHKKEISSIKFSPDDKTLASGSDDNTIILWDTQTGNLKKQLKADKDAILLSIAFCAGGQEIACASTKFSDALLEFWDSETGEPKRILRTDGFGLWSFSSDGKKAAGWSGATIKLFDTQTGELKQVKTWHDHNVSSVYFSPDGNLAATKSAKVTVTTTTYQFSPSGKVTKLDDATSLAPPIDPQDEVRLWDAQKGELKKVLNWPRVSGDQVNSVIFSPDGSKLALQTTRMSGDSVINKVILFDPNTGEKNKTLTWNTAKISDALLMVGFSSNSKTVVSWVATDKILRFWDAQTGELRTTVTETTYPFFSPDDKILIRKNQRVTFLDAQTGELKLTLPIPVSSIGSFEFSPDGKILAISNDKEIKLWDTQTGELRQTISGHKKSVTSVSFSHDGKLLASVSKDKIIRLWKMSN